MKNVFKKTILMLVLCLSSGVAVCMDKSLNKDKSLKYSDTNAMINSKADEWKQQAVPLVWKCENYYSLDALYRKARDKNPSFKALSEEAVKQSQIGGDQAVEVLLYMVETQVKDGKVFDDFLNALFYKGREEYEVINYFTEFCREMTLVFGLNFVEFVGSDWKDVLKTSSALSLKAACFTKEAIQELGNVNFELLKNCGLTIEYLQLLKNSRSAIQYVSRLRMDDKALGIVLKIEKYNYDLPALFDFTKIGQIFNQDLEPQQSLAALSKLQIISMRYLDCSVVDIKQSFDKKRFDFYVECFGKFDEKQKIGKCGSVEKFDYYFRIFKTIEKRIEAEKKEHGKCSSFDEKDLKKYITTTMKAEVKKILEEEREMNYAEFLKKELEKRLNDDELALTRICGLDVVSFSKLKEEDKQVLFEKIMGKVSDIIKKLGV